MKHLRRILCGAGLCAALSGAGVAMDGDGPAMMKATAETVVATVNGTEITLGHMIAQTQALPEHMTHLPLGTLFDEVLDRLIQQEAIAQKNMRPSREVLLQMENERRSLLASAAIDDIVAGLDLSDEAMMMAYEKKYKGSGPVVEYNASHILVETKDEAMMILDMLEGGAEFADTARTKSTGPSGPGGGALGWFGPGRMVPEFEMAVKEMEIGTISAPVQTQFGWHVIRLNDIREPGVPSFEDVRASLEDEVFDEALRSAVAAIINAADVELGDIDGIDPNVLGDVSLIGG